MTRSLQAFLLLVLAPGGLILLASPPVWPVGGTGFEDGRPPGSYVQPTRVGSTESALFGCVRNDGRRFHEAIDIGPVQPLRKGEATDPVLAAHAGTVVHVNRIAGNSSYGRYVVLEHPGLHPAVYTLYAHLSRIPESLRPGVSLRAGDILGTMGRSAGGYVIPRSQAHLHFEVGLRLSDDFQTWYDRQGYDSGNHHGNYNGMNLVGWDPLDYAVAFRDGRVSSTLEYLGQLPPAAVIHVRTTRRPDFLERYPELELPGVPPGEQAGWEIHFSAWGLPLAFRAVGEAGLRGLAAAGGIRVVAVNANLLEDFACRDLIGQKGGQPVLGSGGRRILELLFMPDSPD